MKRNIPTLLIYLVQNNDYVSVQQIPTLSNHFNVIQRRHLKAGTWIRQRVALHSLFDSESTFLNMLNYRFPQTFTRFIQHLSVCSCYSHFAPLLLKLWLNWVIMAALIVIPNERSLEGLNECKRFELCVTSLKLGVAKQGHILAWPALSRLRKQTLNLLFCSRSVGVHRRPQVSSQF